MHVVAGLVRSMNGLFDASLGQRQTMALASVSFVEVASEMGNYIYSSPINMSSTTTIKAKAFKGGWTPSYLASATYAIGLLHGNGTITIEVQKAPL